MELVHIQRDVFNALGEIPRESYVRGVVQRETEEYNDEVQGTDFGYIEIMDVTYIVQGIISLIVKNEGLIQRYTWDEYLNESYPASEHCSGFYYSTGKYAVNFFDISADNAEDIGYSFNILKVL